MSQIDRQRLERLVRTAESRAEGCSCDEFAEHVFELIDAEMPDSDVARLAAHASGCPQCNERHEAERHLREILRSACCEQSAPDQLRLRIVEQFMLAVDCEGEL